MLILSVLFLGILFLLILKYYNIIEVKFIEIL